MILEESLVGSPLVQIVWQRLQYLEQYLGRNCWGDLLSRWVKVPSVPVRSVAVHSPCDADDSLPSVDVIRAAQRKAVADLITP